MIVIEVKRRGIRSRAGWVGDTVFITSMSGDGSIMIDSFYLYVDNIRDPFVCLMG